MKTTRIIKQVFALFLLGLFLAACAPSESVVQTAVAQTMAAVPSATPTTPNIEEMVITSVNQTMTPIIAALSTFSSQQIETAVIQTLTAIVPTITETPLVSPTPVTPTPTITNTHAPWPTITNTPEPFIPSGPITLAKIDNLDEYRIRLTWEAEGSFLNGFYVLWTDTSAEPTPDNSYWYYFSNGKTRSAEIDIKQAKTYNFRVCELDKNHKDCLQYSNVIQFTVQ
jgi:hypothetical protein